MTVLGSMECHMPRAMHVTGTGTGLTPELAFDQGATYGKSGVLRAEGSPWYLTGAGERGNLVKAGDSGNPPELRGRVGDVDVYVKSPKAPQPNVGGTRRFYVASAEVFISNESRFTA